MTNIGTAEHVHEIAAAEGAEALLVVVRNLVAEVHAQDRAPPAVSLDSKLDSDLGLDSIARVELLVRVEKRFAAHLPETVLANINTVSDLLRELRAMQPAMPHAELADAHLPSAGAAAPASTRTLMDALRWHVVHQPDRVHVVILSGESEIERVTYGELERRASIMAGGLATRGLRPGDCAALMLPTGSDFLASFYAVLLAGGIPVPLYPPPGASRIADHLVREAGILENCGARVLITVPEVRPFARMLRARAPAIEHVIGPAELESGGTAWSRASSDGIALLQYTSGSTGRPKGVVLTHDNLLANIRAMGRAVRIAPDDVFVSWLPLYHDMGLIGAWLGSLFFGTPLVLMSPLAFLQRPQHWLRCIHRYRGTLSGGPNFAYELCLKRIRDDEIAGIDLASWRFAFNGAEPVSATTLQTFAARYARWGFDAHALAPVYGLAECSVGLAFPPPGRGASIDCIDRATFLNTGRAAPAPAGTVSGMQVVGCGFALPDHRVRIVSPSGEPLHERREGRIQFSGPSATSGYFRNDAATRALLCDSWLDTGDLGYIAEGELFPTGRIKDLIIRAGRHFHPEELEEAVGRLPGVRQGCVAVFGTSDRATGTERLVVVAETRDTDAERLAALRSAINALAVDLLGAPVEDVVIARPHAVLKTSSGKVRRAETRLMYERGMLILGPLARAQRYARLGVDAAVGLVRESTRDAVALAYAGYVWAMLGLCTAIAAPLLLLPVSLARRQAVAHRCAALLLRAIGLMPEVSGLRALPPDPRYIVVVNHSSYIDAIVLLAALPIGIRFAAKRELAVNWLLRFAMHSTGAVLVDSLEPDRGIEAADALIAAAAEGCALAVFPEGTFRRAPGVLPFHLGAFVASARTGAPTVPIALCGTRSVLPDGTWLPRRSPLAVRICEPLRPRDATFAAAVALRDAAREAIARQCGEGIAL